MAYRIEFTDLFGVTFQSYTTYTRKEARAEARHYRLNGMWHLGRRCSLRDVRAVEVAK